MTPSSRPEALLRLDGVSRSFPTPRGRLQALSGVDLEIAEGETVALVGESGSGKSTLGRVAIGLQSPDRGRVVYRDAAGREHALKTLSARRLRRLRADLQIVFQDPSSALDPRLSLRDAVAEPLLALKLAGRAAARARAEELLADLGLDRGDTGRRPHEVSGGQRQRVLLARALAPDPRFLLLDEPVSALDVSLRAQVVNLLMEIRRARGLTMLLITHDLSVVPALADRIAVLYLGHLVEILPGAIDAAGAAHPYTRALLDAVPRPDPREERARLRTPLSGEPPSPIGSMAGCPFATRCPRVGARCRVERPPLEIRGAVRRLACFDPWPIAPDQMP